MEYGDSDQAKEVAERTRKFVDEVVVPVERELLGGEPATETQVAALREEAREWDVYAPQLSTEYGGMGLDFRDMLPVFEQAGRSLVAMDAMRVAAPDEGNMHLLELVGTDEQKDRWLEPLAAGDIRSGFCMTEPLDGAGSDPKMIRTTARKDGDEWVIDGEKYWIGNGVEADWVTLYAKTGDDEDNRYGNYSLFIVPTDAEGYEAEHIPEKMAMRASKQAHITLDGCRIPEDNLIGVEGAGFYMLAEFFNHGRVIVGGQGIGIAAAAIEEASEFVHDREAFGRTVDEFQAVQHHLADMRLEFESARTLVWRAADKVADSDDAGYWAALAKTKATETATECAETGMQLHGGRSVLTDRRISRVFRDSRIPVIYEGANDVQRNLIYRQAPR